MLQRWLFFWKVLPSPPRNWSSVKVTSGFLVTSLTKALLLRLLRLAGRTALGRVLVVPNFYFKNNGGHCVLGPSTLQKCFGTLPQECLDTILSLSSTDNSFDLMAWFLLWHALSTVWPYIDKCVNYQIMLSQLNLPQVDSNQVVETSQGWSMETGCTWVQFRVS